MGIVLSESDAKKLRWTYRQALLRGGFSDGGADDLTQFFYGAGVIAKLEEDVDGYEITEDGLTGDGAVWGKKTTARIWFPWQEEEGGDITGQEKTTEGEPVDVWNMTPYDLKAEEEVWLVELGRWIIAKPVRPLWIYATLTEDLTANTKEASADSDEFGEVPTVYADDDYLGSNKKLAEGKKVYCFRRKKGYFVVAPNACEVADE